MESWITSSIGTSACPCQKLWDWWLPFRAYTFAIIIMKSSSSGMISWKLLVSLPKTGKKSNSLSSLGSGTQGFKYSLGIKLLIFSTDLNLTMLFSEGGNPVRTLYALRLKKNSRNPEGPLSSIYFGCSWLPRCNRPPVLRLTACRKTETSVRLKATIAWMSLWVKIETWAVKRRGSSWASWIYRRRWYKSACDSKTRSKSFWTVALKSHILLKHFKVKYEWMQYPGSAGQTENSNSVKHCKRWELAVVRRIGLRFWCWKRLDQWKIEETNRHCGEK